MLNTMPPMTKSPTPRLAMVAATVMALLVPTAALSATKTVSLSGSSFRRAKVEIKRGDIVKWRNDSVELHTITSYGPNWSKNVTLSGYGQTAQHRFRRIGTYRYRCTQHSTKFDGRPCEGMCGVVKVIRTG